MDLLSFRNAFDSDDDDDEYEIKTFEIDEKEILQDTEPVITDYFVQDKVFDVDESLYPLRMNNQNIIVSDDVCKSWTCKVCKKENYHDHTKCKFCNSRCECIVCSLLFVNGIRAISPPFFRSRIQKELDNILLSKELEQVIKQKWKDNIKLEEYSFHGNQLLQLSNYYNLFDLKVVLLAIYEDLSRPQKEYTKRIIQMINEYNVSNADISEIKNNSLNEYKVKDNPLEPNHLTNINFSISKEEEHCIVCMDTIKEKALLSCGHYFCKECILRYIQTNNNCPICRTLI